ncbi:MAG: hypothetical protein E6H05_13845 [Bacillati bacterium ANGP1]|uniref:Organic solvent tolerance-like N-terminal domain-containing protein n=1 Tax=Candidatus Segetimicrobium genomatis TaxID=2569760 RepID=A0A537IGA1_9BACT|nr:MAG: hypothetical protein E6H05_13845 [Terrabacteria group bacterium ANGP1]
MGLVTNHQSPVTRALVGALVLPLFLSLFSQVAAAQESPPLVVDAQQVIYDDVAQTIEATGNVSMSYRRNHIKADFVHVDLRAEQLEARGHVTIIDSTGRELRGEMLTFYARGQVIELSPAEAIIDGVYIRSDRMRSQPGLIAAGESTLTTCHSGGPGGRQWRDAMGGPVWDNYIAHIDRVSAEPEGHSGQLPQRRLHQH